jgi:hypothetical protein
VPRLLGSNVREALKAGTYGPAFDEARRLLLHVDLAEALDRTLAVVDTDPILYDAMAVVWIVLAIEDRRMTLHHVGWAVENFEMERETRTRAGGAHLRGLLG